MTYLLCALVVVALAGIVAVCLNDHRRHRHHDQAARVVTERLTFREVDRG